MTTKPQIHPPTLTAASFSSFAASAFPLVWVCVYVCGGGGGCAHVHKGVRAHIYIRLKVIQTNLRAYGKDARMSYERKCSVKVELGQIAA